MLRKTYHTAYYVPVLGLCGVFLFGYLALYAAGVVNVQVLRNVQQPDEVQSGIVFFFVIAALASGYLVLLLRVRVRVANDGLHYRGILRSVYIAWSDVVRVRWPPGFAEFGVWSEQSHISIYPYFSREAELKRSIIAHVRDRAASAVIDRSRQQFLPRWRRVEK